MNWDDLQVFLAVVRAGRVSAAARRLDVEHTTVARRLAALETALGVPLFYRTASGYELTAHGRNVLSSATVRVGAGDEQEPCQALTDSTGLARFDSRAASANADGGATSGAGCKLLDKPATLTVSATGHAPSTAA